MRIVFAGIIGRYPWGGVAWCSLMYLLGLRKLGHDVYYLEDTCECNYDPEENAIATNPAYALRHIDDTLRPFDLGDSWCYVDYTGKHHGIGAAKMEEICRSADLFLVLSGGCWVWRDHYLAIPRKAFIDSDPAFTQLAIHEARNQSYVDEKKGWYVEFFNTYDALFTFGSGIARGTADVPTHHQWLPTWQPVDTSIWQPKKSSLPTRDVFTTVMTWRFESFQDIGGNKDHEFLKVIDLPSKLRKNGPLRFELAVSGPMHLLRDRGWECVDAFSVSSDIWRYHNYISGSLGEFSVAKGTYVSTRSGWFSDRTICYLSAGRPAVVQETGFSDVLPTGEGLFAWRSQSEALRYLEEIHGNYDFHSRRAREIAGEHFRDETVLTRLLGSIS